MSGLTVVTMTRSMSCGVSPALSIAAFEAFRAISEVVSPSAAMRRRFMPDLPKIHSSLVSTIFERSSLVTILSGTYLPVPFIIMEFGLLLFMFCALKHCCRFAGR